EPEAEADEALRGDGGGGAVHGLVGVEGIGVLLGDVAHGGPVERGAVPVGDAVEGGVAVDVVVGGGAGGLDKEVGDGAATADAVEVLAFDGVEEFELLGVAGDDPGGAAGPGGEGRVALLR